MVQAKKSTQSSKKALEERQIKAAVAAKNVATAGTEHVKTQVGGFLDFIRSQGVIGLAVGLAIGTAAGDTVRKLVEGFINPIVQFIVGSGDRLSTATWHVELFGRSADFAWGAALSSAITLLATALVIYWLVHVFKLDKLDKKKS
jgi:large conductance mechanosensitive channel